MLPVGVILVGGALWVMVLGVQKTVHGVKHLGQKIGCVVTVGKKCPPKKAIDAPR